MRNWKVIVIFLLLALLLIACQEEEPTPEPEEPTPSPQVQPAKTETAEEPVTEPVAAGPENIVGITWQWEAFEDQSGQNDIEVDDPAQYEVVLLPEGQAAIKADCNVVNMGYSLEGNSITLVGPGVSTMAFCGEESLDQQFLGYLNNVATWVISPEEKLVLNLQAVAGSMIFDNGGPAAAPAATSAELVDITNIVWQWEAYQDTAGQNDIGVDDPASYTVTLLDDGTASIKADCNQVMMPYTLEGSSITFSGPGISTLVVCIPGSLDQQFLDFLDNVVIWVMSDDDKLVFNLFADAGNMVFNNGGELGTEPAASIEDIQNILWYWSSLVETLPASQSVVHNPENYAIAFLPEGLAPVQADCNQVGGSYAASGSDLTIVLGPTTATFCGEDSLDQQYLSLLSTAASFELEGNILILNLANGAGEMQFAFGEKLTALDIDPDEISLDTQGLASSWEASVMSPTAYDESMPPGPMGLPEHIQITFNGQTPNTRTASDPVMYIVPVTAYEDQWARNGNDAVSQQVDAIYDTTINLPYPAPIANMPVLPVEEVAGVQDFAVQVGRASATGISASKNGFRFVGRFAQDLNPVTSDGLPLRYIYQGFTNDGQYLVLFFWTVNSGKLPTNAGVADAFNDAASTQAGANAFLQAQAELLNSFTTADWTPDLAQLDKLVGSLTISSMPESGIQGIVWQLTGQSDAPGGDVAAAGGTPDYFVVFSRDGEMAFKADCNSGSTVYNVTGGMTGSIAMRPAAVTLAECGTDSDSQLMIDGLATSQNYRVHPGGDVLELVRPADEGSLYFLTLGAGETVDTGAIEVELPPADSGEPSGTVVASKGMNVRSGPGTIYPIVGWVPNGASGQILGRSADGGWWAVPFVDAPGGLGWVSAAYVDAKSVEDLPVIPAPPPPVPTPTPTPNNTPAIEFWADAYSLNLYECTMIHWQVENVSAVWVYPSGQPYEQYPATGVGSLQVCPPQTTTYELRVLLNDGSIQIRQVTINTISTNPLVNSSWLVSSMYITQVPLPGTRLTVFFDAAGTTSGSGGCNNSSGPYVVSGNAISLTPINLTNAACGQDVDTQEQIFITAMQSARTFQLVGSQLVLYDAFGQEVVRYNRTG